MSLPVGAYKRARLVGGLLIAGGMYGAELTNVPGHLKKKVRTAVARAISGKALNSRRCLAGVILAVPGRPLEPDVAVPADVVHGWGKRMFFTRAQSRTWKKYGSKKSPGSMAKERPIKADASTREGQWQSLSQHWTN